MTPLPLLSDHDRRLRLATRHRLLPARRTDDIATIADDLVGLHSSDPATVYLSAMARMSHPRYDVIDAALYDDRTLMRHHAMRRTIWVFTKATANLAHNSTTRKLASTEERRLVRLIEDNDVDRDGLAWIASAKRDLAAAIDELGPVLTRDLGIAVPEWVVPLSAGPATIAAHTRVLLVMGFEGTIVRTRPVGSWTSSQYAWSMMDAWMPDVLTDEPVASAASGMLGRYLQSFGPATLTDLTWWTGWAKGKARAAIEALQVREVRLDNGSVGYLLPHDDHDASGDTRWVALLPSLDPTTMGWKERDWYLDADHVPALFDRNGNAGPTIWVDGRVVGGWAQRPDGEIAYSLLASVDAHARSLIDDEAERLRSMYGDVRHRCRFPTPMVTRLLA